MDHYEESHLNRIYWKDEESNVCIRCKKVVTKLASNGECGDCLSTPQTPHQRHCPYCESSRGFYYDRTIKYRMSKDYSGKIVDNVEQEIVYENSTKRCIKCDEPITSYVKSLGVE